MQPEQNPIPNVQNPKHRKVHRERTQRVEEHSVELHDRNGVAIEEPTWQHDVAGEREDELDFRHVSGHGLPDPRGDVGVGAVRAAEAEPVNRLGLVEEENRVDEVGETGCVVVSRFVSSTGGDRLGPVEGDFVVEVEIRDGGPKRAPSFGENAGYDGLFGWEKGEDLGEKHVGELAYFIGGFGFRSGTFSAA